MTDEAPPNGFGKGVSEYLNTSVALADAKAGAFLAAALGVAAVVLQIQSASRACVLLRLLSIAALAVSVGANTFVIFPRLTSGRRGLVFWEDIRRYQELDDYLRAASHLTERGIEVEYAAQNYFVSDVVHRKHLWVRRGIVAFLVGVGFALASGLLK